MRQETVATHGGKKSRLWLRKESDGRLSRRPYAIKTEQKRIIIIKVVKLFILI
jgi:hypothetical protein